MSRTIRIAVPSKGRLAERARELLMRSGLEFEQRGDRALLASIGDEAQALFVRPRDIPEFVADGAAHLGITGLDMILESGRQVDRLLDLGFGRCRLVLAMMGGCREMDPAALPDGIRVATTFPRLAAGYFEGLGKPVTLVPVSGATEVAPHLGVAEAIVDLVATGSTLKVNGLGEVSTLLESSAWLIADPARDDDAAIGEAIAALVAALESVVLAEGKRYLMANIPRAALGRVKEILPGVSGPTIVPVLDSGDWLAAHAVVECKKLTVTIAALRALGAEGILVTKIERLMP